MAPKDWKLHEKTVPIKLHQGPSEKGKHNIALGNYTHDPTKSFVNAIDSMFLTTMIARPPGSGAHFGTPSSMNPTPRSSKKRKLGLTRSSSA
jgi:hypothetical protein